MHSFGTEGHVDRWPNHGHCSLVPFGFTNMACSVGPSVLEKHFSPRSSAEDISRSSAWLSVWTNTAIKNPCAHFVCLWSPFIDRRVLNALLLFSGLSLFCQASSPLESSRASQRAIALFFRTANPSRRLGPVRARVVSSGLDDSRRRRRVWLDDPGER
jgi:hypothetical protein